MSTDDDNIIISPADGESYSNVIFEPPSLYHPSNSDKSDTVTPTNIPVIDQHLMTVTQRPTFMPLPKNKKGPVGNYYAEIRWENGFENWGLVRFSTPMDGSCLFHAISNSFFSPYHEEMLHGNHVPREKMVAALRRELAEKLSCPISEQPNAPIHYDILNGGHTSAFAEAVPEFALKYMQAQLDSRTSIGYGYMEFIGNALNKDIYILEAVRHDIYVTDELPLTITGTRSSIVLYYMNGHYELVGIRNSDDTFSTHFSPDHSFIRFLHSKVRLFIN